MPKLRYNDAHRLHMRRLLMANEKHSRYPANNVTIVTPYQAQTGCAYPSVHAGEGVKSRTIRLVISSADALSDTGFTVDERRATMGLTRMTDVMINSLPESVRIRLKAVPSGRYNYLGERINLKMLYLRGFMSWAQSKSDLRTVFSRGHAVAVLASAF